MFETIYGGHEAEMEYLSESKMSVEDMRRSFVTRATEVLGNNEGFAEIFGEKTPEDFAKYFDELSKSAAYFAECIRTGNHK